MTSTINLRSLPKSLLHRLGMLPLPRFCSTGTECSQLIEAEGLTASKDIQNLRTDSNPPKLFEIFKQRRNQLPTRSTDPPKFLEIFKQRQNQLPTPSTVTSSRPHKRLHIFKMEYDPQKLVQIFKRSAERPRFRRIQPPYEIAVKKLAFAKEHDAIEEILDHLLQVSEPCSEAVIIRIIRYYGIAGMPQHAIKTFNQMKSLNISPTIKSFNALLASFDKSENPKLVYDFYKDIDSFGFSANLKTYNIVVKAIFELFEHESVLPFLDEMRKHGSEPDIFTYNNILSALYKQGKCKEADDLLGKMTETCPPNVFTYNIRMSHLCKCNKTSDAEKLLDEMISEGMKPDIFIFNTLVAGFCNENNMIEAKRIFSDISRKGCDPNAVTYYTLINFTAKEGHFDTAYEFCVESMNRDWMPSFQTAKMLIDGLVKNNKSDNAREVIEGMKKKLPVSHYNELENISRGVSFGGQNCKRKEAVEVQLPQPSSAEL